MAINGVMTTKEAEERWGVNRITILKACTGQRGNAPLFTPGETTKSGGTWLVTEKGMKRMYGAEKSVVNKFVDMLQEQGIKVDEDKVNCSTIWYKTCPVEVIEYADEADNNAIYIPSMDKLIVGEEASDRLDHFYTYGCSNYNNVSVLASALEREACEKVQKHDF